MRHALTLEGAAFRLRPIGDADAPLVLTLRNSPKLNRFLHATSPYLDDQLAWLTSYYTRPNDYYFVVERLQDGMAEGVISLYDIDTTVRCGEWGRWILCPGSLAAVESAWLIYRCAFETLGLQEVYCRTVADNIPVVSFHDSCGLTDRHVLPGHFELNGRRADAVEHRIGLAAWAQLEPRLKQLAQLTAKRLYRD